MRKRITIQRNTITFQDGFNEYIYNCKARNLREGTIKHYQESMKSISRFIDPNTPISDFDKNTLPNFIVKCRENLNIKDITLYTYARDLKTLMYYFMKRDYMPSFKIALPSADKEPIECYTDGELKALLKKPNLKSCNFAEYRNWVLINFLLSTGVRLNSFINIKIKDLDFDNKVVRVIVTKNRKPLIVPLNETIIKILKEYLRMRQYESEEDYLFCNSFGNKLVKSTVTQGLYQYHHSRGVTQTGIHRYRHTFAKKWIESGGSVVVLQKLLGHSSLKITENYINILISDIKREVDKFNLLDDFNKSYIKVK